MIGRLLSLLVILWGLGFALFAVSLSRDADPAPADAIVVVTGGPGRVERGLMLLAAGKGRRMLISGVDRRVRPHELAKAYPRYAAQLDCCVDLGTEATDTRSNAEETARWMAARRYRSMRLVTTDWHMARARFEIGHALGRGIRIVPDAVRSQPDLTTLLREYHKYLLRRAAVLLGR